jgi:hypothetical protein
LFYVLFFFLIANFFLVSLNITYSYKFFNSSNYMVNILLCFFIIMLI